MDQQSALTRPSLFKRLWFRILGSIFLLLVVAGGFLLWMKSGRVTATALFQVDHSMPSVSGPGTEQALGEYEFEILRRTQLALLQSDFVITAALRNPNIGSLSIIQQHADPVQWLQDNLAVSYPKDGCLLAISLSGNESDKEELAAVVDSIALAYKNEVIDQVRQRRLVTRDLLSRNLDNLNSDIKRKLDEYLDIARESGKVEASNGHALQLLDQKLKSLDRIEDELMRFENQLAIETKGDSAKSKLIEKRVSELRKKRDELYNAIATSSEISADLQTRQRDLDQLQSIATQMSTRLEWLDIEAGAPDRIRQVQPAVISPQGLLSRLPVARDPVANLR